MDYLSDEESPNTKRGMTRKQTKVSPGKAEEEKGPSKSPTKEPDTIMSSSEIKDSWFRRLWHTIIRKKIRDELNESQKNARLSEA